MPPALVFPVLVALAAALGCGRASEDDVAAAAADGGVEAGSPPDASWDVSLDASSDADAGADSPPDGAVPESSAGCPAVRPVQSGEPCAPDGMTCSWPGDCVAVWTCQNHVWTCYGALKGGEACEPSGTVCVCSTGCSCATCTCEPDAGASSWACAYCPC